MCAFFGFVCVYVYMCKNQNQHGCKIFHMSMDVTGLDSKVDYIHNIPGKREVPSSGF